MVTVKHQRPLHCCIGRRVGHLWGVCSPLVGGILASVGPFGAPTMVAGLTQCDHVWPPGGKALTALVLAPLGVQSPSVLLTALSYGELVVKNTRPAYVETFTSNFLFCLASPRRFAYPTCWQEHGTLLVLTASVCGRPAMPLDFSAFTSMALSKEAVNPKSSDRGQTFEGKVRNRISTRWWKPWCVLTRWRARRPLMLA